MGREQLSLAGTTVLETGDRPTVRYAGRLLALLGARVLRLDEVGEEPERSTVEGAVAAYLDRGKESIALNRATDRGRQLAAELAQRADVFLTSERPASIASAGIPIAGDSLRAAKRVVVSVTPFGPGAPEVMDRASDLLLYHGGGLGAITPRFAGDPDRPPLVTGYPIAEYVVGLTAAVSTVAAVEHLRESGEGSLVVVSGQQAIAHAMGLYWAYASYVGQPTTRISAPALAPFHFVPCRDGHVMLICPEQHQWDALVDMMGNPDWAEGELFGTSGSRAEYWDAIEPGLREWMADKPADWLYRQAQARRIPLAPVSDMEAVLASRQLAERAFFVDRVLSGRTVKEPGLPFDSEPPIAGLPANHGGGGSGTANR